MKALPVWPEPCVRPADQGCGHLRVLLHRRSQGPGAGLFSSAFCVCGPQAGDFMLIISFQTHDSLDTVFPYS